MTHSSDWLPGDEDYPVRLGAHRGPCPACRGDGTDPASGTFAKCPRCNGSGKVSNGFYVHLTRDSVAKALGVPASEVPDDLRAVRIVLDPGTRQILIRLKKE